MYANQTQQGAAIDPSLLQYPLAWGLLGLLGVVMNAAIVAAIFCDRKLRKRDTMLLAAGQCL